MNEDRIQEYFEKHIHFTHIADKFNSYRESELRKFINDINIIFNNEKGNNFLSNWLIQMDIKELKNSLKQSNMSGGTAGCTITNLIKGDSNLNVEYNKALTDGIVNILKKYLDISIEANLNQARSVMKQEIEKCVEKYMEDQRGTMELLNKLIIERRTIVNINERTKNKI